MLEEAILETIIFLYMGVTPAHKTSGLCANYVQSIRFLKDKGTLKAWSVKCAPLHVVTYDIAIITKTTYMHAYRRI